MLEDTFVSEEEKQEVLRLQPTMKKLTSIKHVQIVPNTTIAIVKADGEFTEVVFNRNGESYGINKWGRKRKDFPALNQFSQATNKTMINSCKVLCELFAKDGERPLKLPEFEALIKSGKPEDLNKIHIGIWDLVDINGRKVTQETAWKFAEVTSWIKDCTLVEVLPYIQPKNVEEIQAFWNHYIEELHYEGIVARNNGELSKIKPNIEFDAVIIAVNKEKEFFKNRVSSVKMALMDKEGNFVELDDCASGIDPELRKAFWEPLMNLKLNEDNDAVWIKPFFICQFECKGLFKATKKPNAILKLTENGYQKIGETPLVHIRSPILRHIRNDKKVNSIDLRLEQIPQEYLK